MTSPGSTHSSYMAITDNFSEHHRKMQVLLDTIFYDAILQGTASLHGTKLDQIAWTNWMLVINIYPIRRWQNTAAFCCSRKDRWKSSLRKVVLILSIWTATMVAYMPSKWCSVVGRLCWVRDLEAVLGKRGRQEKAWIQMLLIYLRRKYRKSWWCTKYSTWLRGVRSNQSNPPGYGHGLGFTTYIEYWI